MKILFWYCLFFLGFTFMGYPALLYVMSTLMPKPVRKKSIFPPVTVIIAAHNEEKSIGKKLADTLALDYPEDKIEIIVASDGSTDKTNEIVSSFNPSGVRLLALAERAGKTGAQNQAAALARGNIIVFSDATTRYERFALKKLVENFADPDVGAAGGELCYTTTGSACGRGGGLYWRFERFLKRNESMVSSLIGVSGCCYAVRKDVYEPIPPELISDFVIAQMVYKKGKRVVYETEAVSFEEANDSFRDEFRMRVRVGIRTLYGLWRMRELLNPARYGLFSLQLFSHKVCRYCVPVVLAVLFFASAKIVGSGGGFFYVAAFAVQLALYASFIPGLFLRKRKTVFGMPFYFCLTNAALFVGLFKFLSGERQVIWNPSRK